MSGTRRVHIPGLKKQRPRARGHGKSTSGGSRDGRRQGGGVFRHSQSRKAIGVSIGRGKHKKFSRGEIAKRTKDLIEKADGNGWRLPVDEAALLDELLRVAGKYKIEIKL